MTIIRLCAALFVATVSTASLAADKHGHAPLHGGVVSVVKEIDFELIAKPDLLQLHVRDHGKPLDVSKATAKQSLLSGTDKQDVELKPVGGVLEAKGSFKVGAKTKAVALVSIGGQTSTVRFVLK